MATSGPGGLPIPAGVASPLALQTYVGAPDGMSRLLPQHEIADTEAYTIVDANLSDPGFIRRRGPLTETPSSTLANSWPLGIARCQDPSGAEQNVVYVRTTDPIGELHGFGNTASALTGSWPYTPAASSPADLFCASDALGGGTFIGTASKYEAGNSRALQLWRGAGKVVWVTIGCSVVHVGDTTITGVNPVLVSKCAPGHFVYDTSSTNLIGVIKSISGTTLTLEHPALRTNSGSNTATPGNQIDVNPIRAVNPRVATGRITTSTSSAVVNGGDTKFKAQLATPGDWDMYTSEYTFIGQVSSVSSDAQLTLAATANVALTNGSYLLLNRGAAAENSTACPLGWITAQFAGHQFYADGNKLWFSSDTDPEAVDTTGDGDFLTFSPDPIRAIIPAINALVVVTETEAFALTGAVGTTPNNWRGERIHDDGTICGMACMPYQGGALWTGKRGIWFWNGASPTNVVGKLDGDYRLALSTFSSASSRAYCAVVKDHYLVWIESVKSGVFDIVKGASTTHITRPTFVINLGSGAISIWNNVEIRGGITPPDSLGLGTSLLAIQTLEGGINTTRVVKGDTLFTDTGQDAYTCNGAAAAGPDLYVETKKYSMGDGQRLKLFRMLLLHFLTVGGNIKFDTVPGLNATGTTSTTEFWTSTSFIDKRIKFNKKSQYLALRIYQSLFTGDPANLSPASTTRVTLGQWALGFKWKRAGRV